MSEKLLQERNRLYALFCLSSVLFYTFFLSACQNTPSRLAGREPTTIEGSISSADYEITIPGSWNGTLILYSHGYILPGHPKQTIDLDTPTSHWLLQQGYALAGSSYSQNGWAVEQAFHDQIALLDLFTHRFGSPRHTIAWGTSLGGLISLGLGQQFPTRFAGVFSICGVVNGSVSWWNGALDLAFAFKWLLAAPSALQVVHITNPQANVALAQQAFIQAQQSSQGRARLALIAALGNVKGWYDPTRPEPAPTDYAARLQNQFAFMKSFALPNWFGIGRTDIEARAGGNPSWNSGVDYAERLHRSTNFQEVQTFYQQTGLSLNQDLQRLEQAPPISADAQALSYLSHYIVPNGQLSVPVLTLHTTGDSIVPAEQEFAYTTKVHEKNSQLFLHQLLVHRANHCTVTDAESITAFQQLIHRIQTGQWNQLADPQALNAQAQALGAPLNVLSATSWPLNPPPGALPAFVLYRSSSL